MMLLYLAIKTRSDSKIYIPVSSGKFPRMARQRKRPQSNPSRYIFNHVFGSNIALSSCLFHNPKCLFPASTHSPINHKPIPRPRPHRSLPRMHTDQTPPSTSHVLATVPGSPLARFKAPRIKSTLQLASSPLPLHRHTGGPSSTYGSSPS